MITRHFSGNKHITTTIPDNIIYYTSNDGLEIYPHAYGFGANLVDNTYTNGQGMMIFDGSVTSIGSWAFVDRSSLTSITIPNSVTSIGYGAFESCSSLTSVTIPNSVTSIGARAFTSCHSLTSVTIGNGIVGILDYAFLDCRSLTTITCESTTPPTLGSGNDLSSITEVYVPAESVDAYKTANNWSYYADKIQPIP